MKYVLLLNSTKLDGVIAAELGVKLRNNFPNYYKSRLLTNPEDSVLLIEKGCLEDIDDKRFLPYIQLHEFEGLLFSDTKGFEQLFFPNLPNANIMGIIEIVNKYPNPELINDHPNSAPSKSLERLIPEYNKPLYGNMIALENGFDILIKK